ncbi:MAG: WGxxGxxG family protein [Gemmatimonadota bacterium]
MRKMLMALWVALAFSFVAAPVKVVAQETDVQTADVADDDGDDSGKLGLLGLLGLAGLLGLKRRDRDEQVRVRTDR